ncbi:hypothetical protein [Roseateles sp. P5_E7]
MINVKRLLVVIGFGAGTVALALLFSSWGAQRPDQETCARSCAPQRGVIERSGPAHGSTSRPARNEFCVCKAS